MSVRLMAVAWALDLSSTDKLVLLALADWSNDDGHCWPSMKQLCEKSGLTDRAVQKALSRLGEAGHLTREEVRGKGVNYFIHPGTTFTPERRSPPNETTKTPERRSPNTSITTNITKGERARGSRIPDAFEPILTGKTKAIVDGWPPGMLDAELEQFRDHHTSKATISHDWQASFRTWARNAEKWRKPNVQRPHRAEPVANPLAAEAMRRLGGTGFFGLPDRPG